MTSTADEAALASARSGTLAVQARVVRTVSGDSLLLSIGKPSDGASGHYAQYLFAAPDG